MSDLFNWSLKYFCHLIINDREITLNWHSVTENFSKKKMDNSFGILVF